MMNYKILAITFLTCVLLSTTEGRVFPQCRCSSPQTSPIRFDRILKFVTIPPGPHCKDLQVIFTVKFKKEIETCVNPKDEWVQEAMKKFGLRKSDFKNEKEFRPCFKQRTIF